VLLKIVRYAEAVSPRTSRDTAFILLLQGFPNILKMRRVKADTLEADSKETFVNIEMKYGHRWPFFHRADLHSGLRELVENFHGADGDVPAIRLSSPIVDIDCESGTLKLDDGRAVEKDLVVIADGAHVSAEASDTNPSVLFRDNILKQQD